METENGVVAVLFDIDGTLISSGGAGGVAWRMAFAELYGVPAEIGKFSDAGMTDPEVGRLTFRNVVGRDPTMRELAKLLARRQAFLPQAIAQSEGYAVLPGVPQTLRSLVEHGYLLGLTTGGTEAAAHIKLERGRLNHFFCFGGYGSDSADRVCLTRAAVERAGRIYGQALACAQVLVVGDTPRDIDAARGAGARSVGVASGHFSVDELRSAGADCVLASLEDALPL